MKADPDAIIATFGKNEHVKNVFRAVFVTLAVIILTQVVDPATAQQIAGIITGRGM